MNPFTWFRKKKEKDSGKRYQEPEKSKYKVTVVPKRRPQKKRTTSNWDLYHAIKKLQKKRKRERYLKRRRRRRGESQKGKSN